MSDGILAKMLGGGTGKTGALARSLTDKQWFGQYNPPDTTQTLIDEGKRVASNVVLAMVVPGSGPVKEQAEREGLDRIFADAGFEWRQPGCSMCLAMNNDRLGPGERCASTSNRNFEGRQGAGGRTHLVSPAMAAGAAIAGHFVDVRSAL